MVREIRDWINLHQDKDLWWTVVKMAMSLYTSYKAGCE